MPTSFEQGRIAVERGISAAVEEHLRLVLSMNGTLVCGKSGQENDRETACENFKERLWYARLDIRMNALIDR